MDNRPQEVVIDWWIKAINFTSQVLLAYGIRSLELEYDLCLVPFVLQDLSNGRQLNLQDIKCASRRYWPLPGRVTYVHEQLAKHLIDVIRQIKIVADGTVLVP